MSVIIYQSMKFLIDTNYIVTLKDKLRNIAWDNICDVEDTDNTYNNFADKFQVAVDECIPKKVIKKRDIKRKPSPWVTQSLLNCINRKNRLYKKSLTKPSESNILLYKKMNLLLELAKQNYFSCQLEKERYNMRNTWKVLNSILRSPKKKGCNKFVMVNKVFTAPQHITDRFNK